MSVLAVSSNEQDKEKSSSCRGRVVVYPQKATWIGLLQRPLAALRLRIEATATLSECREALDRWPQSLLVLELTPDETRDQLRLLSDVNQHTPGVRVFVVARGVAAECELLLRELGVCDVIRHVTDFGKLTAIARLHAIRHPEQDNYSETLRAIEMTT